MIFLRELSAFIAISAFAIWMVAIMYGVVG